MDKKILTADEAKAGIYRRGLSLAAWAKRHKVKLGTLYTVLNGTNLARFGEGHRIAVLLGMKDGTIEAE